MYLCARVCVCACVRVHARECVYDIVCVCVCVCQVVNEGCFIGERLLHTSCDDLDCSCL